VRTGNPLAAERWLVALKTIPAGLSVFRMGDDGKLTFLRKYDVDVGDNIMFWIGMVPL
jgi:6-phosphogluconolactonase